jgi:DNA polymerase-3 subunit delta'
MQKVFGNTEVVSALHSMVESGRVPHAILFHEDDGSGAFPIVLNFLEELYGGSPRVQKLIHPDIHFVFPVAGEKNPVSLQFAAPFRELALANPYFKENELYQAIGIEGKQGNISVVEARSILDRLSLSAVEGGYRTVVMYLPEKMNAAAANALLKMVEEPPQNTLFAMITHAPEKVLTTISSRCLHLRVMPLSAEAQREVHAEESAANTVLLDLFYDLMQAVLDHNLLAALETGEAIAELKVREQQKAFCRLASQELRTIFLLQQKMPRLASVPPEREELLARIAGSVKPAFPRFAMGSLDRALQLIERNVNQKIIFTDLVSQLYTYGLR